MKQYILPKKIVLEEQMDNSSNLFIKKHLQIELNEQFYSVLNANGYIVLDFGKELCGGVRLLTFWTGNSRQIKLHIRFGESLTECCSNIGDKNATNDHSPRDFFVNVPFLSDLTFGQTGFRFVRIDNVSNEYIQFKSILAENNIFYRKTIYNYNGKDVVIKKIFNTAKRTINLCASGNFIWDGIKRDRIVWIGDMHPEMLALVTLYGELKIIEDSLDFVKEQTPLPNWMNNFPTYSMWWIIIVADYFIRTNNRKFAFNQLEYMKGLIKQMNDCVQDDGTINYPHYFVDWQTSGSIDEKQGVRCINIIACKKAIGFLEGFNEDAVVAKEMLSKLLKKEIVVERQKQVIGLKYFAVGLNEKDKKKLLENGVNGFSTFMSYYILKAIASFDKEKAVEMLKEYYGAMLNKGATTFWEDFDIRWTENSCRIDEFPKAGEKDIHGDFGAHCYIGFRHSLCHGWSAGIIKFIKEIDNGV
ncbi:MAG: hypothetical protein IJQ07_01775 [Clostridia bacterium]|nr:hypothetical protein [Clostridia bacterium]